MHDHTGIGDALGNMERMIAPFYGHDRDFPLDSACMGPKLNGTAERVTRALHEEYRYLDPRQVLHAELLGLAGRVQWVAQAHEAGDARLAVRREVGRHAGAERLSADEERRQRRALAAASADVRDDSPHAGLQHVGTVRQLAASLGVRKVEGHHQDALVRETRRHADHERVLLVGARAVGQHESRDGR